jgi:hypothetical protein
MADGSAGDAAGGLAWLRRALVSWPILAVLGVANGTVRELLYRDRLGESLSHQVSGVTLAAAMAVYTVLLERRWRLNAADARRIGAAWLVLTLAFEFTFGRFVDHKTWSELFHDYNLAHGRTWPLVLAFLALLPSLARAIRLRREPATPLG